MESAADNASLSVLPAVVETEDLDKANSQISAAQLVADEFAGPPLGGLMFAAAIALPFAAMGALYAAAAVLFLGLRLKVRPERLPGQTGSIGRDLLVGARWLKGQRLLFGLAVIGGLASVAYMIPFSILVLYCKEVLGLDAAGYGVLLSASAVGGLVGSIVAVNRPDFDGDSPAWRKMESWQNTAAPAARSSGGTRPSSENGPSGWSSRPPASGVNGSARSRGWPASSASAPSPCASGSTRPRSTAGSGRA